MTLILLAGLLIGPAASAQGAGYWHTSGSQIYDSNNQLVRIAGINWYGFETTDAVVHGLSGQDYKVILQTVQNLGYNTIRVPFSNQMVETPSSNLNISYWHNFGPINSDLQGLNSIQVLDRIVSYAGTLGLKVILDNHRSEAGNSAEANGLWYTGTYPEANWIADWQTLASRYAGNTTVIGFDLRNEPHNANSGGACWDCGGANDWHLAAARAGNAVLSVNPDLLIFVEGTDAYNNDYYWWGGNLEGVANSPVTLAVPNRLVYSAHDYGPEEYGQSWFPNDSAATLQAVWTKYWAYISQKGTAPVWVGEFGTKNSDSDVKDTASGSQGLWFSSLVSYLKMNPSLSWTCWALNGEDAYGLLDSNYDTTPVNALKQATLATIQFPLSGTGTPVTPPGAPSGLTAVASSASQVSLSWTASPAAGATYTVYFGTSAGSIGTVLTSGVAGTTYTAGNLNGSTTYYFNVTASSAGGTSAASNTASVTTRAPSIPAAPTGLTATVVSSSQINLTWQASSTSGATYNVYSGSSATAATTLLASGVTATSYGAGGLTASTTYYFTVKAVVGTAMSAAGNVASATTQAATVSAPAAPFGLSASPSSSSQINLNWQPSTTSGVTYNIYSGTSSGGSSALVASGVASQNFTVTNLLDNTMYFFTVKALSAAGTASAASNQASATTQALPSTPPSGLSATAVSQTQISLSWSAVPNTGATYAVYYGTTNGAENTLLATGLNSVSYQATGLSAASTYYFVVRSISAGGTSAPSAQASATTQSGTGGPANPPNPTPTVPAAPGNLAASASSSAQVSLSWAASGTSGVTYNVYTGTNAASVGMLVASGLAGTSFSVTGLTPGTTYFFAVTAVNSAGSSPASNVASATTQPSAAPAAPDGLSATAISASQINLSWTASSTAGVTYSVYTGGSSGGEGSVLASGLTGTGYSAANLTASTSYFFIVKAVSGTSSSPASNETSATTQAPAAGGCHVAYTDQTDWGAGFTGGLAITNNGSTAINSWMVSWAYSGNQQIYQSWNSNYAQSGHNVTLTNAAWNGSIAPGGTVSGIGWNANYNGANPSPVTFYVNGVACH